MTIQYKQPVRNNVPQQIGPYTFKDQGGAVIDLISYVSAALEVKLQGQVFATVTATILAPTTNGQVQVNAYTFVGPGIWDAQFVCTDGSGNKLYGEPIQIMVVPNVDDLSINQLPNY